MVANKSGKGMRINRKFDQRESTDLQGNINRVFSSLLVNPQIITNQAEREVSHEASRSVNSGVNCSPVGRD